MGGPSSEREVSLVTGKAIFDNLDKKKYEALPMELTKDGRLLTHKTPLLNEKNAKETTLAKMKEGDKLDMIFIAMHGSPGEDGTVQGMLELLGIPYTGSNTLSSALAMNKVFSAQIYVANGLPTPMFVNFKHDGWKNEKQKILHYVAEKIKYPCVLKPVDQGSSVGVYMIRNEEEMVEMTNKVIKKYSWLMAQTMIKGKEATCGVLEIDGKLAPLPPVHIIANKGEFYDIKSKYGEGGSTHICPADFPEEINEQIQTLAIQAHRALGCRGMSRTDIFYADDGQLYIIETNSIPGMTPTSLLPEEAGKIGISFSEMLDHIIKASK